MEGKSEYLNPQKAKEIENLVDRIKKNHCPPTDKKKGDVFDRMKNDPEYIESMAEGTPKDFFNDSRFSNKVLEILKEMKGEINHEKNLKSYFYKAGITSRTIDLIKERSGYKNIEGVDLVKKLVILGKGSRIYLDNNTNSVRLGGDDIIAIKSKTMDEEKCISGLELYIYLGNLSNNSRVEERKHTIYHHDNENLHPVNFPIGRTFFAESKKTIKPILSKNNFVSKKLKNETGKTTFR